MMYVFHRTQASALSLVALIAGIGATVLSIVEPVAPMGETNPALSVLSFALSGVTLVVFGYLGWRNATMPNGLGIVAISWFGA